MANEPIDELEYLGGVKVVQIEDLRVARGKTRRPASSCRHRSLSYDQTERRIWCRDCEQDVDAFDAFMKMTENIDAHQKRLHDWQERLKESESFQARSLAAREIDKAWRKHSMVPACPHCNNGLFPEDFKNGRFSMVGIDYAKRRLGRK